jgi:hypothetical protein
VGIVKAFEHGERIWRVALLARLSRCLWHGILHLFREAMSSLAVLHIGPIHTGVFNIADVAIMAGIGVVVYSFRSPPIPEGPTSRGTE